MAINYAIKRIKNPKGSEGVKYYHAQAIKTSEYNFDDLMDDINSSTPVTEADAMAVLRSMKRFVTRALLAGQVVVLQDLGRLQVSLQGKCYPTEVMQQEEFSPSAMIKSHRIVFRPNPSLKKEVKKEFKLKRISSEAMA